MKLYTDSLHKIAYATDASVYREIPYGVAYPDTIEGIQKLMRMAATLQTRLAGWEERLYKQYEKSNNQVFIWTIEHIFPEGENIPQDWVDMIAGGDRNLANEYLQKYVHKLGNLTVTGYNSALSNYSFCQKRDRTNKEGKYIGYKNGLEVNRELAEKDSWTVDDIIERTDRLVKEVVEMFAFPQ